MRTTSHTRDEATAGTTLWAPRDGLGGELDIAIHNFSEHDDSGPGQISGLPSTGG